MGGKSAPKAPAIPDPSDAIETQARVNRVNTISPFGSTTFFRTGAQPRDFSSGTKFGDRVNDALGPILPGGGLLGPGQFLGDAAEFTQVNQFSPELQEIFDTAVGESLVRGRDAPFEGRTTTSFTPSESDQSRLEQALFDRQIGLLEPEFQRRERGLRQSLSDRGLPEGSEAFVDALASELDAQNRARERAALDAVVAGRDAFERDRGFDLDVFRNDFQNRFALDEGDRQFFLNRQNIENQRDQIDFSQLVSILGGFNPNPAIAPIDAQGAINNSTNAAFDNFAIQSQQAAQNRQRSTDLIGSLASLLAFF